MTQHVLEPAGTPDTREKILDAAEALFVELGFQGTSLRAIACAADVNLAATHYHFGSKQGLLAAVVQRRANPINEQRLQLLKGLTDSERPLTIKGILEAFLTPVISAVPDGKVPGIVGRLYTEPEAVAKPIMEDTFKEVATCFQKAIAEVLPGVSPLDIEWRFHFMIGSMIHLLQLSAPLGTTSSPETFNEGVHRLIDFVEAGLTQP